METPGNEYYLNIPQMRSILIDAQTMVLVYGRRMGKSTEIIAHLSLKRVFEMPRASFMLLGRTYKQLLERTLPATKTGWAKRGYIEDVHYVVGKRPPKMWAKPFYTPSSYDHTITWCNGFSMPMGSQDREGLVNSLTVWGLYADEAKLLLQDRFMEDALPTVSAPTHYFPNSPHNRSIVLCTSMPSLPDGQWIFDYEKLMDKSQINLILNASIELEQLKQELQLAVNEYTKRKIQAEIIEFETLLSQVRRGSVFYNEASTFANINILGMDYIKQQQSILKDKFMPEILNIHPDRTRKSFYANLNQSHFYTQYNYQYIDSLKRDLKPENMNCKMDADLVANLPLRIGFDFGARINCIVTAQRVDSLNIFRTLKNHFVTRPKILDDVCKSWCEYYQYHKCKILHFYYDNSGNNQQANSTLTYAIQARNIFEKYGWNVIMCTSGGANVEHHQKYLLINTALIGNEIRYPKLLFNEGNCEELKESMLNAPSKEDAKTGKVSKDKSSERKSTLPAQYATDLSDAWDVLFWGEYKNQLQGQGYEMYDVFVR